MRFLAPENAKNGQIKAPYNSNKAASDFRGLKTPKRCVFRRQKTPKSPRDSISEPVKMADDVTEMYEVTGDNDVPQYVKELRTPSRRVYGSDKMKTEAVLDARLEVRTN